MSPVLESFSPEEITDRQMPEVPGVRHHWRQVGDLRFHVAEAGEGPPLVLLHGWPEHWFVWRKLIGRRDHPDEACGVVAGPAGSDRPLRFVPMLNAARSPTFYEFDPADLLALYREMDERDEEPVVIYHSHTATEAYPSRTDIGLAGEPDAHYVLVSTREHGNNDGSVEFRSFRIVDGEVSEEDVVVVRALDPQRAPQPRRD